MASLTERLSLPHLLLNPGARPGEGGPGQEVGGLHLLALTDGSQLGGGQDSAPAVEVRHLPREMFPLLSGFSNQMESKYFQIFIPDLDIGNRSQRLSLSVHEDV